MTEDRGIWLYAVTRQADPAVFTELAGVSGEKPRVVEAAELAAVIGDVPLDGFGEDALRRNLEDLDWLADVAYTHDAVIAAAMAGGPVVPIRLATMHCDDERVREMLRQRAADFRAALDRVTGRTEWGVKVFLGPEQASEDTPSGDSSGTAYLARRRKALSRREKLEQRAVEQARRVHFGLTSIAVDTRTHPPQSRALAGGNRPMILNAAYLVENGGAREFTEAVTVGENDNDAIRVQLTGPWPPYSFASLEET